MLIYGKNLIADAIKSKRSPVVNVTVATSFSDKKYLEFLDNQQIKYKIIDRNDFNLLLKKNNLFDTIHQSIIAYIDEYKYFELEEILNDKTPSLRVLILDQINDPHNLGAILRTLVAASYDYLIISRDNQVQLSQTVAKVSSGAIEYAKVILVNNLNQALNKLKERDILIVGTDLEGVLEYKDICKTNKFEHLALILGSEGKGMRPLVKKNCDLLVKIPIDSRVNSLNVSVACGILLFSNKK